MSIIVKNNLRIKLNSEMVRDVGIEPTAPEFMVYLKQNIREVTAVTYVKRLQLLSKVGNR